MQQIYISMVYEQYQKNLGRSNDTKSQRNLETLIFQSLLLFDRDYEHH